MKVLTIKRIAMSAVSSLGVMFDEQTPFALTMELPWANNEPNKSCIPKGEYLIRRVVKIKHGECFEILDVPGRSDILIHKGNFPTDSRGCVILGEQFEDALNPAADKVVTAVLASGKAYSEFMTRLSYQDRAKLVILEV